MLEELCEALFIQGIGHHAILLPQECVHSPPFALDDVLTPGKHGPRNLVRKRLDPIPQRPPRGFRDCAAPPVILGDVVTKLRPPVDKPIAGKEAEAIMMLAPLHVEIVASDGEHDELHGLEAEGIGHELGFDLVLREIGIGETICLWWWRMCF
nr:hypothetical protein [Candidatus Sigynarchaeota archaeon]